MILGKSIEARIAGTGLSLGLLVSIGTPAWAEPRPGQLIWSNITYGMLKEQVSALYPNKSVNLGNGCSAGVNPKFQSKRVVEVQLSGAGDEVGCDTNMLASLSAKYGTPRSTKVEVVDPTQGRNFAGGGLRRFVRLRQLNKDANEPFDTVKTLTWFTGETLITLYLNETLREWSVLYQPAELTKPALTDKI